MSDESGDNVVPLHPDGVEALARETASRVAHHDRELASSDDKLDAIWRGQTPWQHSVDARLRTIANQTSAILWAHVAWPSLAVLATLFLGGFAATLVWLIARAH